MTDVASTGSDHLQPPSAGAVIRPDDPLIDEARKVWNADIDRRPAVIVRCSTPGEVVTALGWARSEGLEIAVRGGAHSVSGASSVDGGMVIDLGPMRGVRVDPAPGAFVSAVVRCTRTSMQPARNTALPYPLDWSRIRAWGVSPSAGAWDG
jgi:hypothetical protein